MNRVELSTMGLDASLAKQGRASASNASFADVLEESQRNTDRFQMGKPPVPLSAAEQDLHNYVSMSTEERFFEMTLRSLGISKEEYEAMTPAEKEEIARLVQERITERVKENASSGRASTFEIF
ncbi:hypothetical protein [Achromobacter spanius]|jgi:hypothetical protein|uniref:hypothetical protein n=1 Tax=Achromobacter spanius TaxID=217203 RepID=UPI000ACA6631|nr:hypothetical protein [Achromobacter spanius]